MLAINLSMMSRAFSVSWANGSAPGFPIRKRRCAGHPWDVPSWELALRFLFAACGMERSF